MLLKNKNALITGARRGIGRATAEVFARNGANIWACARKHDAQFEADMEMLAERYGVWIHPVYFDLADETQRKQAVQSIVKEKQPVDILVNNAGEARYSSFSTLKLDELERLFTTNYVGALHLTQMLVRRMARNHTGAVVFLSSVSGIRAESGALAYGGSKVAIAHAVGVLARELAPSHIRVNAVAPGLVNTDMKDQASAEYWATLKEQIPMKRMAEPEEIANVIAFLSSDLASYITGQVYRVDGGM